VPALHRSGSRRVSCLRLLLVLCSSVGWLARSAHALDVLPGIPSALPAVGVPPNGLSAVRYSMGGGVTVLGPVPPATLAADGFSDGSTQYPTSYDTTIQKTLGAGAESGSANGTAVGNASAGFGTLRASAVASGGGGYVVATSAVTVSFIDLIQVDGVGGIRYNFDIKWKTDGTVSAMVGEGSATALAQLWLFPFGTWPQPGQPFFGQSYRSSRWEIGQVNGSIGTSKDLPAGARFWVYGQLEVTAARGEPSGTSVETPFSTARADFMDTVQLFIDPGAGSPDASVTSVSGWDYATPVPEPSGLSTACAAAGTTAAIRLRRRSERERRAARRRA
jgi:hypothetical protein